mmetsp:Transcript_23605/g.35044  ORF Transcript_23605/g.35044 Transcript_23605/m.35044 type:complete len:431 (+) Transcript_23605:1-1293(+)
MDNALETIHISSSVKLGLGPRSGAVERVENSSSFQNSMDNTSASGGRGMTRNIIRYTLSVKRMRVILFQVMEQHHLSLCCIFKIMMELRGNENENDMIGNMDNTNESISSADGYKYGSDNFSTHGISKEEQKNNWDEMLDFFNAVKESNDNLGTYTLAILKACRRCSGELLSVVLSHAFDFHTTRNRKRALPQQHRCEKKSNLSLGRTQAQSKEAGDYIESVLSYIRTTIQHAEEQRVYLKSCFALDATISNADTEAHTNASASGNAAADKRISSQVDKYAMQLQQHIEASNVMLWALMQDYQQCKQNVSENGNTKPNCHSTEYDDDNDNDRDGNDNDDGGVKSRENLQSEQLKANWDHMTESLQNALIYRQSLEQLLFPEIGSIDGNEENSSSNDRDKVGYKQSSIADHMEYSDSGGKKRLANDSHHAT